MSIQSRRLCFALLASSGLAACASFKPAAPLPEQAPGGGATGPTLAAPPSSSPPDLPVREELPYEAREMLSTRMARHGQEMTAMMVGVLLLEYDLVYMLASDLAEEPKLGRPAPHEKGTLNALLPASFFLYQDALVESAQALARAAADKHDKRLGEAFGQLAQTCVGCHSTYLHEELNFGHEEPGAPLLPCPGSEPCLDEDEPAHRLGPALLRR